MRVISFTLLSCSYLALPSALIQAVMRGAMRCSTTERPTGS